MSARGTLGWVLLAVALSVPVFMFWNWWQAVNGAHKPEPMMKKGQPVFAGGSATAGLSNPIAAAQAASLAAARSTQTWTTPGSDPVAQKMSAAPLPVAIGEARSKGPAGPPDSPATAASVAVSASASGAAKGVLEAMQYNPQTDRDPTLSPNDMRKLAEIALRKRLNEEEMAKRAQEAREVKVRPTVRRARPAEASFESRVRVVGIITVDKAAPTAILENGKIIKQGDNVQGATVTKISPSGVVFIYKKRKITMTVNR